MFTGFILKPIPHLLASFRQAAQGDLTAELPVSRKDEIGHLALGFNQMLARQRDGQLNQVTQENAAMVQELSSSCQLLNEEAERLRNMVNHFKVDL
ncbi:MAG: methyl-accepting chemotaxis protein [Firmicutes bacterium]|nr:methyl-accepting chemotaxis protein [Bacillota bacterium]